MKKLVFLLVAVGAMLTSCDPMEDIYNDLDKGEQPIVGSETYTLEADDYTAMGLSFTSFDSEDQAKETIPGFLEDMYPYWGKGSSVLVGYNLYVGNAEGISDYTGAEIYQLTNDDYAASGSDAFGFYPDTDAASKIEELLSTAIASPEEGKLILAKYKQYVETPEVGLGSIVEYNFASSFEGWTAFNESGPQTWTSQLAYVEGNGYSNGQVANVDWLISPSIDLTGETDLKFQITHAIKYAGDASLLKILVSTNYTGDTAAANWTEINLSTAAGVDTLDPSEDYDFSAYDGQKITIALKYQSTDADAGRWRVSQVALKTLGVTGETDSKGAYFMYTEGAWEAVEGVYYLSVSDYDAMGEGSGQPGQYNNFSSSISPDDYLPTFLKLKYPYAQEEAQINVIYDYYSSTSGAQIRGNEYTVTNGVWVGHTSVIATTLQFGHDGETWVPDNTIKYQLVRSDYDYMAAQLASEPGYEAAAASMGNYGNLDRRPGQAAYWSDDTTKNSAGITDMIAHAMGILLSKNDPNAEEGQKYLLTYDIYNGTNTTENIPMIKTDGAWVRNN